MLTDAGRDDADEPGGAGPIPIAAVGGARSSVIQPLLAEFAARRSREGMRVVGVVEEPCPDGGDCALFLRDLATSLRIAISQNLGPGSTACNLDAGGLAAACGLVQTAIAAGADLVVLSKFGKVEADRHGLTEAFQAAIAADLPIVTAVAPSLAEAWTAFAGPLSVPVAAEAEALEAWWSRQARAKAAARSGEPAHQR
ncbi:MAG: DUF2478 domain-containing protein [Rhodoplanes sp.]|uniref:DUF2478 domain-containing protein n=1 Tax=Rhodoplanes sp. TaxID=1968906 RepID=UPI0017FD28C1|nr:DUF2478 domain-containing protein [Rhodoplanes sp.]NVO15183.1 DUF2478 domain-containing protein [Rhodoplanes sp.]